MKILIAEDDFASRKFMLRFLSKFGECDITVDGEEAVEAFTMALDAEDGYDLVCLDIMMPGMDGYQALKQMREIELERNISEEDSAKIIMTTALNEGRNVTKAFEYGCVAYAGKPIDQEKFENVIRKLGLLE
ncbi:MAG: two-component system, chemotaxis family, chemotaxis protein CheY [Clostridiales bacterium]|nr:two-component system, chemotaxis family, chemotaxis protein CheY [Clostridiales bacterium]